MRKRDRGEGGAYREGREGRERDRQGEIEGKEEDSMHNLYYYYFASSITCSVL